MPYCFIQNNAYRGRQIQRTHLVRIKRHPVKIFPISVIKVFRKTGSFGAENKTRAQGIRGMPMFLFPLCRKKYKILAFIERFQKILKISKNGIFQILPIVQSCASYFPGIYLKAQLPHKNKFSSGGNAGSTYVSGIPRYLRIE